MLSSPPPKFFSFLSLYHILPIHFPLTLWVFDAPFGRFGRPDGEGSRWWINGELFISMWRLLLMAEEVT